MALQRFSHTGAAPATGLTSSISSSQTSFAVLSGTGYPTGSGGPFTIAIDQGLPTEEHVLCSSISAGTVTVAAGGRGYDNTIASAHNSGPSNVELIFTAAEADDDNAHVYTPARDDHTQYAPVNGARASVSRYTLGSSQGPLVGPLTATVQMNTLTYDTLTGFNTSTYKLTCPVTGYYRVVVSIETTTSGVSAGIYHNGSLASAGQGVAFDYFANNWIANVEDIVKCTASDTLWAECAVASSVTATIVTDVTASFVTFELIH